MDKKNLFNQHRGHTKASSSKCWQYT